MHFHRRSTSLQMYLKWFFTPSNPRPWALQNFKAFQTSHPLLSSNAQPWFLLATTLNFDYSVNTQKKKKQICVKTRRKNKPCVAFPHVSMFVCFFML
jgi:hypothetical protein